MIKMKGRRKVRMQKGKTRGQTMVEFALILPILLITLFMLVELARVLHAWMAVENGARFGVRYAVTGEYDPANCPGGVCSSDTERKNARLDSIYRAAEAGSASILQDFAVTEVTENGFFNVTVCDPDLLIDPSVPTEKFQCFGGEDPGEPGEDVTVVVEFTHPLITPFLTEIVPNLHLSSKREAIVETFRVVQAGSGAPGADPPDPGPPVEPPEPPPPPDPCENVIISDLSLNDKSSVYPDRMWGISLALYNNNYFEGTITTFTLDWDRPDDLDLLRWVYRDEGTVASRRTIHGKARSGPVNIYNLDFLSQPQEGMPTMYGEFCVDYNQCSFNDDDRQYAPVIPGGTYNFIVDLHIDFGENGSCDFHRETGLIRATPRSGGGGGGGGDPFEPPDPPPGGEEPPPGGGGDGPSD